MKIIMLLGAQPNQVALAAKVARNFDIAGIVFEKPVRKKIKTKNILVAIASRIFFPALHTSWMWMMDYYSKETLPGNIKTISVENINLKETAEFIQCEKPDLIMVSGTSLLKKNILNLPVSVGIVNLHTGLSPYVKGGPNCTNWCLANNTFHLIGNTVMWIDAGIDSGDIITTEFTKLSGKESLPGLHLKVMEHAHDLYLRAVKCIVESNGKIKRVTQSEIAEGKTYYTKQWTFRKKLQAIINFRKNYNTESIGEISKKQNSLRTIPLPG